MISSLTLHAQTEPVIIRFSRSLIDRIVSVFKPLNDNMGSELAVVASQSVEEVKARTQVPISASFLSFRYHIFSTSTVCVLLP